MVVVLAGAVFLAAAGIRAITRANARKASSRDTGVAK
jgi:hypothetical protein